MAHELPQSSNPPLGDDSLQETRLFEPVDSSASQERDIALAAELLECGNLTDRQVTAAVSDWSLHGSVSLAEHIQDRGLLSTEQLEELQRRARSRAARARQSAVGRQQGSEAGQSVLLATLERIDRSGRVAKLLGVTVVAGNADKSDRVFEGRYELIRKLGQGGLGRVWLARDRSLNRHVALKEISREFVDSDAVIDRFKREAEITGRLEHPSIVPIYQAGSDNASGRVFYTMRFLGKATLQDSIIEYHERRQEGDDNPMLLRHLLSAFVNICHAVGHAHSRKVIHRDLKPENVVIDSFGQVIVIDWGLAKVLDDTTIESISDSVSLGGDRTNEGQVLGTPLYMAPEQAAGRLDELDHRTDIYGLGAILYSIVTGVAPHENSQRAAVESGAGTRGLISSIVRGEVPSAGEVVAEVDPALEAICAKAMARRRYARYQSATDLGEDVQRWMAGEPVTAHEEPPLQRLGRWVALHSRLSQTLGVIGIVILVALTTLAMAARQSRITLLNDRFAQMQGDVREVKLQLRRASRELFKDARFVASLPPIQGIASARAGLKGDSEEVWRARLETIFTGMLRSNPNYLALTYVEKKDKGDQEIVRVERNPSDPSLVRVLPPSRLHAASEDDLLDVMQLHEPGDVKMTFEPRPRFLDSPNDVARLSVATPVYSDATGEFFGIAVVEADISQEVKEVLLGLGGVACELFVADGQGKLWVSANPEHGVRKSEGEQPIRDLSPEVAAHLQDSGRPFEINQSGQYVAERFYLDPTAQGIVVFARLLDEQ